MITGCRAICLQTCGAAGAAGEAALVVGGYIGLSSVTIYLWPTSFSDVGIRYTDRMVLKQLLFM